MLGGVFLWRAASSQPMGKSLLETSLLDLRLNTDNTPFGIPHRDSLAPMLWRPTSFTTELDDVLNHVRAKDPRALSNDHLAIRVFIELDSYLHTTFRATLGPTVLEVVETNHLAAFDGKSHGWSLG